jgi:hypothetical protein
MLNIFYKERSYGFSMLKALNGPKLLSEDTGKAHWVERLMTTTLSPVNDLSFDNLTQDFRYLENLQDGAQAWQAERRETAAVIRNGL